MRAQARKHINTRAFARLFTIYLDSHPIFLYEYTYLSMAMCR